MAEEQKNNKDSADTTEKEKKYISRESNLVGFAVRNRVASNQPASKNPVLARPPALSSWKYLSKQASEEAARVGAGWNRRESDLTDRSG